MSFLSHEVSDLCIGKPALRTLPISATVGEALSAIRRYHDIFLCAWSTDRLGTGEDSIVGKLCMVDILCYLCADQNISSPSAALQKPVSNLLSKDSAALLRRVELHSRIVDAVDAILEGAQVLLVPLSSAAGSRRKLHHHSGSAAAEFCWLTQEDLVRFFFNSVAFFYPIASSSVAQLGLVRSDNLLAVQYYDPALSAIPLICRASLEQTSVAVVTEDNKLIGEISPSTLAGCEVSVAAALCALLAGDFMAYMDCSSSPTAATIKAVKSILRRRRMPGMLELMEEEFLLSLLSSSPSSASSSSDEEGTKRPGKMRSAGSYSARMGRRSEEAIVCHPKSSLVAVMAQALAHRVGYVWVVGEDYSLAGVVTFRDILKVFRCHLEQRKLL